MVRRYPLKSEFKTCFTKVDVPKELLAGVNVIQVNSNGKKMHAFLTVSKDKSTIYVTTSKLKNGKVTRGNVLRPMLARVTSYGSVGSNGEDSEVSVSVDVGSIDRVLHGQNTLKFELARKIFKNSGKRTMSETELHSNNSFSIFYLGSRTLDLVLVEDEIEINRVLDMCNTLIKSYSHAKLRVGNDVLLLRYIWLDIDTDNSNAINSSKLGNVLDRINFYMKKSEVSKAYKKFGKLIGLDEISRKKGLTFEQCVTFLHKIKRDTWQVKPVHQIWTDLFGEFMQNGKLRTRVSAESFLKKFLWKKQGETKYTIEDVRRLFQHLNNLEIANKASNTHFEENSVDKYIDKDRFEAYLVSEENDAYDPEREKFDSNIMFKPLSEYWINSSHNTFLTGDQFNSRSSVEMYMNALYRGCRCLELDTWDGDREPSPTPIIYHGYTRTTKIQFRDVIMCFKKFLTLNPKSYPLILSIENHCSIPYQVVMAEHLLSILGDLLYIPHEKVIQSSLPSPEDLIGKVVLKGRRLTGTLEDEEEHDSDTDSDDDSEIGIHLLNYNPLDEKVPAARISAKVAPELSKLTLFHGTDLENFVENAKLPSHYMHSFNESKVRKFCNPGQVRDWIAWVSYNKTHMSRCFPSGKRMDSSNYSPIPGWSTGCQMIALNFQTNDFATRLNDGRFRENGGCGYVLKPSSCNSKNPSPPLPIFVSIRILSGYCLPKPYGAKRGGIVNPYVKVVLYDITSGGGLEKISNFSTKEVHGNGFFPIWNQGMEKFRVDNSDIAMLQLTVWDKDVKKIDRFIASSSIPISCLREGYRNVKLYDGNFSRNCAFERASLLIEVEIEKQRTIGMW